MGIRDFHIVSWWDLWRIAVGWLALSLIGVGLAQDIDDVLSVCPTREEVAAIDKDLRLTFVNDPTAADGLVCRAAQGSADLTRFQERAYQLFRVLQYMSFDLPLPWTELPVYEWVKTTIRGARFDGSMLQSSCCGPGLIVNMGMSAGYERKSTLWQSPEGNGLEPVMSTLMHEVRHADGDHPHTCGDRDRTIAEFGSNAVVLYWYHWLGNFSSGNFLTARDLPPFSPSRYRSGARNSAQWHRNNIFCDAAGGVAINTETFGQRPVSYDGPLHTVVVTATSQTPIQVGKVELAGTNPGDFRIAYDGCSGQKVSLACVLLLRFTPAAAGPRSAELTITDDVPGSPHRKSLTGTGVDLIPAPSVHRTSSAAGGSLFLNEVAPGGIVTIWGRNLAHQTSTAAGSPLPPSLGGAVVNVGEVPARLYYASPEQVNIQIPWEVTGPGQTEVAISVTGPRGSATVRLVTRVVEAQPAVFTTSQGGSGQGAILISGTASVAAPVGAFPGSRAARRGEYVEIYSTGLGRVSNRPSAGSNSTAGPLSETIDLPSVTIGGFPARVAFSGLAPGTAGLYQVNAQIPAGVRPGNAIPLTVSIAGRESKSGDDRGGMRILVPDEIVILPRRE